MSFIRKAAAATAVVAIAATTGAGAGAQVPAQAGSCPTAPDPAAMPSTAQLKQMNTFLAKLGARPTGSRSHARYVAWIRKQLKTIPGIQTTDLGYKINRWSSSSTQLTLKAGGKKQKLLIAGPVPYSKPTGRKGVSAPLAYVPTGTDITTANSSGKIVVRPAPAGSIQQALFLLPVVSWSTYDPNNTINPADNFKGDFIAYLDRIADLKNAAAAGAKGILFVKPLPRKQIKGHYEPYEGLPWGVPGLFLGADAGKQLTDAIDAGGKPTARITLKAGFKHVTTPSVEATLPGASPQRIVIDSHTDGTNAVEDNGPIAMVAMARYFASLSCRLPTRARSSSRSAPRTSTSASAARTSATAGPSSSPSSWTRTTTRARSPRSSCSSTWARSTTRRSPARRAPACASRPTACARSSSSASLRARRSCRRCRTSSRATTCSARSCSRAPTPPATPCPSTARSAARARPTRSTCCRRSG